MAGLITLLGGCVVPRPPAAVDYRLPTPRSQADCAYLGLSRTQSSFTLDDIHCQILVVDCFDMYCHLCQSSASHVNELYRLAQDRNLGGQVKFIGLGVGDSPLEVTLFKDKLKVPFPVFPDRDAIIARRFGPLRVPNLIVLRNEGGRLEVLHAFPGVLRNPAKLLSQIQAALANSRPVGWTDPPGAPEPTCGANCTSCKDRALWRDAEATPCAPSALR